MAGMMMGMNLAKEMMKNLNPEPGQGKDQPQSQKSEESQPPRPSAPSAPEAGSKRPNFCPNCGAKNEGANFCPNCGQKLA
jgi:membrane protease subunit (stomatin/prohibitin family)